MAYRILIVDDEPALQSLVKEILTQAGYETVSAMSCTQALEQFHSASPDGVLLDVMLPGWRRLLSLCRAAPRPGRSGSVSLCPGRG